jgi:hypothetical protein
MKILNPVYDKLSIVEIMSKGSVVQGSKVQGSKVQVCGLSVSGYALRGADFQKHTALPDT